MCLKVDQKLTKKLIEDLSSGGSDGVRFFKIFKLEDGKTLRPLFQHHIEYKNELEQDGWLKATIPPFYAVGVGHVSVGYVGVGAYHAYCKKEKSQSEVHWVSSVYQNAVVREVIVPLDSIVGCDADGEVAFKRMRIVMKIGETI